MTNNDLQNITQKTKDRVTRTPLNTGVNPGGPEEHAIPDLLEVLVALLQSQTQKQVMHEEVFMTSDTYPRPFVRRIFHNG